MADNRTPIYHISHRDNLSGIISSDGVIAQSMMEKCQVSYCNIAHATIQDRRSQTPVPCGPGGHLHNYVPFYFAPRSPMLYAIHKRNVDGCTADQTDIIYVVSCAERVLSSGLKFVFTDGHGTMELSDLYDLDEIDWSVMKARYWRDTDADPDRKRRRQAEFLVYRTFPWDMIEMIAVIDQKTKIQVEKQLINARNKPPIEVKLDWYY